MLLYIHAKCAKNMSSVAKVVKPNSASGEGHRWMSFTWRTIWLTTLAALDIFLHTSREYRAKPCAFHFANHFGPHPSCKKYCPEFARTLRLTFSRNSPEWKQRRWRSSRQHRSIQLYLWVFMFWAKRWNFGVIETLWWNSLAVSDFWTITQDFLVLRKGTKFAILCVYWMIFGISNVFHHRKTPFTRYHIASLLWRHLVEPPILQNRRERHGNWRQAFLLVLARATANQRCAQLFMTVTRLSFAQTEQSWTVTHFLQLFWYTNQIQLPPTVAKWVTVHDCHRPCTDPKSTRKKSCREK